MEPLESAAGQKCAKEVMEKNLIQKRWVSTSTKRSTFANLQGEKHLQRKCAQSSDSGMTGTPPSPAVSHSSHESEFPQPYSGSLSDQLPHSNPQPPTRETFPVGTKPQLQPGMDTQGWAFSGQPQSHALEDFFPRRSRGRGGVISRRKSPGFPFSKYPQSGREQLEDTHKKEQRPKKPGKYICHYCGRACAKPSVLKKHIRSHTGERPYPCVPCGFSFKTKSNLYKHRKSHAHAIKAGLVPFSELATMRTDTDQASPLGEGEVHSDGEQSTDTDEDTSETAVLFSKSSPLSSKASRSTPEKDISEAAELGEERVGGSAKVPLLIVPKQGTLLATLQCPKLVETETSPVGPREGALEECHTVKQRLALRLHEKKGQDSESSYNLLSPHSKGSTDSGYFSRSESAEQQVSPPITNAKSYEEIMFGKYYRPSPRPRQPITVGTVTAAHKDINVADLTINPSVMQKLGMSDISEDLVSHIYTKDENMVESVNLHRNIFVRGNIMGSQRAEGFDQKYSPNLCQSNTILLETPTDTGSLIRSNSMPTSSVVNLDVPPGLRGSHSFDERMTTDDVFYPGAGGLRRLTRQAAFELSAHEGHAESDNHGAISKTTVLTSGGANVGELSPHELKGYGSYGTKAGIESYHEIQLQLMHQRQAMETATRKRRKEKSVGDEDDSPSHCSSDHSGSIDILGSPEDYDSKLMNQDALRATPTGKGQLHSVYSQLDSIDIGARMSLEDRIFVQDSDRKAAGNVISVIQHTNSLSRPSSFEKSDSVDHLCYQQVKPSSSYSEHSDSETTEEVQSMGSISRSESMEQQQSESDTAAPQRQMPHRLVRQPNIQVPEIRVTEEPDKPEKVAEVHVKEPEKHVEEFQWPQRSETLSQLPAEKLPPKKKRLRLAEIEHSSGESSFESTCTSLSRSPSQESNLSHTSSISMSFDREESIKLATPMKQEDIGKQSEFLTVPGSGHSLSVLNQHQQREMRRSSSEQVPCTLPTEIPEMRSKSFDYGSLSSSSRQGEMYASASSMKERRRGYLVRQASLSVHPESMVQEKGLDMNIKQEHLEQMHSGLYRSHVARQSAPSPLVCTDYDTPVADVSRLKRNTQPVPHLHTQASQLNISEGNQAEGQMLIKKSSHSPGQQLLGCDRSTSEMPSREVAWHPSHHSSMAQTSFLSLQPGVFWNPEAMQRHKQDAFIQMQQLQKPHIRQSSVPQSYQKPLQSPQLPQIQAQGDSKAADTASDQTHHYSQRASTNQLSDLLSKTFPTSPLLLPLSQPSLPGMLVPVRVQTNVLSYGSMMYTTVSQMLVTHAQGGTSNSMVVCKVTDDPNTALTKYRLSPSQILTQPGGPLHYPWKVPEPLPVQLNTGIPLALTCGTISTTDASSMGGSKRLLSPASSLELFKEIKQQKRVKEERMYGQIVEELSAVELGNSGAGSDCGELQKPCPEKELCQRMPLPMIMDSPEGTESPDELEVDEPSREEGAGKGDVQEGRQATDSKRLETMQVDCPVSEGTVTAGGTIGTVLLNDIADVQQASRFPSLRTTTSVSWCFLNYTKPNDALTASLASVYASWCVSSYNPNPPSLSTKSALGLLCSKQKKNTETYAMASMCPPGMGKVVSSYLWKQKPEQEKPELMQLDMIKSEKKPRGISCRDRVKEDHKEKEVSSKQAEPTRIKIFEGGYKSNEDYVYVRGRGRGKYICEECGIRCKKPSMLKKHIRSHTDVRPYVCKFCNFAFKTKGNLTKHMKSKAHTKKCLELGVPVTSVDDVEAEETDYDQRDSGKTGVSGMVSEHQFSDADDSEGAEEDGDEIEEEDDDDDEYEGDSTPKTCSRSTSPRPDGISSLSSNRDPASELSGPTPKHPLFSYFLNPPSIQITQLAGESLGSEDQSPARTAPSGEGYRKNLDVPSSMEEDSFGGLSPEHGSASPVCGSSPARETSPTSRRYLSPRRDLSPRGRLSPRREASPLRHISPKRRDLSPRGHLAAISSTRPLSPGRDIPGRRELSPRSRHRGMMRAASPRRGLHHHLHSAPWDLGQYLLPEAGFTGQEKRKNSAQSLWLPGEMTGSPDPPTVAQQGLFSHLPLHSQRQVRTPLPMIPIGGIQVVHSTAGPAYPARLPLQRNPLEGPAPDQASLQLLEGMANAAGEKGAPGSQEKLPSSPGALTVTSSACGSAGGDMADPGNEDSRQEESIQTCTKAIASLRIASEDAHEKVPESADPHCHPPPPPPQPHHRHHTDPSEGAQVRIQHFSGSEQGQCQADILATSPDSLGSERDKVNTPETPPGHAPLLCKSANERLSGQQGLRENENKHKDG